MKTHLASLLYCVALISFLFSTTFAQKPELVVQTGHSDFIESVVFCPDGKLIASGSRDGIIKLWEVTSGRELRTFLGHSKGELSIEFSPDGKTLASGSWDKTIRLWDVASGKQLRMLTGHSREIAAITFSPDGKILASGSWDKTIKLWDVASGKEVRTLIGHDYFVYSISFSKDGKTLASGSLRVIKFWDVESGKEIRSLTGHSHHVLSVLFSPDKKKLASSSPDGTTRLWDVVSGQEIYSLTIYSRSIGFSPDGKLLAGGSNNGSIRLWDVESGKEVRSIEASYRSLKSLSFSPDGKILASGDDAEDIRLWDVESGKNLKTFARHSFGFERVAFSNDGKVLAHTGYVSNKFKLWKLGDNIELVTLKVGGTFVRPLSISPEGKILATASEKAIELWDVESGKELRTLVNSAAVTQMTFSPDGKILAAGTATSIHIPGAGSSDNEIKLWEVESGKELNTIKHTLNVYSISFSPDGKMLASGSAHRIVMLWDVKSGKWLRTVKTPPNITRSFSFNIVSAVSFSPEGEMLASWNSGQVIELWDAVTWRHLETLDVNAPATKQKALKLFPRLYERVYEGVVAEKFIAERAENGKLKLFEKETHQELASLIALDNEDWAIVTPDGRFDTNRLDDVEGLNWVVFDDSLRALPLAIFMRPLYEPRLLPRLLAYDHFKDAPPFADLNRVQPKVTITDVRKDGPDTAAVTVKVENVEREFPRKNSSLVESGAKDLRLFRDGQLIGYRDGDLLDKQQSAFTGCEPVAGEGKKCQAVFKHLQLPRQASVEEVEFSAYAFNTSDVKSETARHPFPYTNELPARKGRAYLITVGVNSYENPAWNLEFAANDAHLVYDAVSARLRSTGKYDDVIDVLLTSEERVVNGRKVQEKSATKENFRKVLRLLAGEKFSPEEISGVSGAGRIEKATPEDVVMIFYSSHGYRDTERFYLFPYDTGAGDGRDPEAVVPHAISNDDLYLWLRDVDAGDIVLVIDACHAGAVIGEDFKAGPMGSRGMGQLAYDKGMRILAATQPDTTAVEVSYINRNIKIKNGLLTYALIEHGLIEQKADNNKDKLILLPEWLGFGVEDVPKIYQEIKSCLVSGECAETNKGEGVRIRFLSKGEGDSDSQYPHLFDFTRKLQRKRDIQIE